MFKSNFYEKSILGKIWMLMVGGAYILVIAAVLEKLLEEYKSYLLGFIFVVSGFLSLFVSKIPLFKKRIFFSFGTGRMNRKMGCLYILGYMLLILGFLMIF